MPAPPATKLDGMQVLQHAFEDSTGRLRVDSTASVAITGVVEVAISNTTDSIAIGTSGQLFTGTASGGQFGLDVNVLNPTESTLLLNLPYDSGTEANPTALQQVFTTYSGGLAGTPVQKVTLNFVDSTRENLVNWQREYWNGSMWVVG